MIVVVLEQLLVSHIQCQVPAAAIADREAICIANSCDRRYMVSVLDGPAFVAASNCVKEVERRLVHSRLYVRLVIELLALVIELLLSIIEGTIVVGLLRVEALISVCIVSRLLVDLLQVVRTRVH